MLNKGLASFLAVFLGIFGLHQFYIGRWWTGALQFGFFWFAVFSAAEAPGAGGTFFGIMVAIAVLIPVLTGILWAAQPKERWYKEFDPEGYAELYGEGITNAATGDGAALKSEGIKYYRSADYDLAVEAFIEAVRADATDPGSHFNLACSYAQLGRYPETLQHLELSITHGLPKPQRIEKHPALLALRKMPAFEKFRANNYRRQDHVEGNLTAKAGDATIPPPKTTAPPEPEVEHFEDFATPPPRRSEPITPDDQREDPMNVDLLEQISRLRELHDAGVLTAGEYQVQKERLLG